MSLNDFVILQKLGSGSFASVYKARRLIDQKIYAIKKIDLKALGLREKNNALNQIRLLACLKSPYIIGYCESFFEQKLDILCIAMEYADGGDLYKKIQKHQKQKTLISEIQIWKIFIHLLYGLNELHSRSILHRDLKSQNVFIANQTYKIGDMNVSKIVKNGRLAQTQTGTPYYASPEVWNDHPYNEKSDIWSLGCILYEITALRPPFQAKSMQKLYDQVNHSITPKIPKNYSRELQQIIDHCLQKNPNFRPFTKDLLSNSTIKRYENMLIEEKPSLSNQKRENLLLKTIYMPVVKKELNNKLPQSNYKSDRIQSMSKELSVQLRNKQTPKKIISQQQHNTVIKKSHQIEKTKSKVLEKQNVEKGHQLKSALSQIQPILSNIENIINQNKTDQKGKNDSKSQQKSKSKSKDKDQSKNQNKITQKESTNRKRVNSCKIFKDKQNKNNFSRKDLLARAEIIIDSQKLSKAKPPLNNFSTEKSKIKTELIQKEALKIIGQVIENDRFKKKIEQTQQSPLLPRKLIFEDENKNKAQQTDQISMKKTKKDLNQNLYKSQNKSKLNIQKDENLLDISKSPYLGDTIKNLSNISQKNHQYYNFGILDHNQNKDQNKQVTNQKQNIIENGQFSIIMDLNQNYLQNNESLNQEVTDSIQIKTIMNEKIDKIKQKSENNQLNQSRKVSLIVGFQKFRSFYSKSLLKINLFAMTKLKNQATVRKLQLGEKQSVMQKKQQQKIQSIHQNDVNTQNNQFKGSPIKIEQKRPRSKSIPKLQKPKQKNTENQQLNNFLLQKIAQKDLPLKQEKCTSKQQQSVKKCKQNNFSQNKSKEIPKFVNSNQNISKENNLMHQQFSQNYFTDQKQKRAALIEKRQNNILSNYHQKSHKKIFPQSIFSQDSTQFDIKKRKIFEDIKTSNNLVHNLNNQFDRMNLERKFKKYINV